MITNPKSRIVKPLEAMGYAVVKDYHATRDKTLDEYILGKQVWYSLSHGGTDCGVPETEFLGLKFIDGNITADMLPPGLNYRLVMVDGCCSASTGEFSRSAASVNPNVSAAVTAFADKFGSDVAYVGWAWTMDAGWAQYYTGQLTQRFLYDKSLKRGRTVTEAHAKLVSDYANAKQPVKVALSLMKLYGSTGNVIDLRKGK